MPLFCCTGIHRMVFDYYDLSPVWTKLLSGSWIASQLAGGDKLTNLAALTLLFVLEVKPIIIIIFLEDLEARTFTEESTLSNVLQSGCHLLACKIHYYSTLNTAQPVAEWWGFCLHMSKIPSSDSCMSSQGKHRLSW